MSTKDFAKLFQIEGIGQVLVVQHSSEPDIEYTYNPNIDGLGLTSITNKFASWEACDLVFESTDEKTVEGVVAASLKPMKEAFSE